MPAKRPPSRGPGPARHISLHCPLPGLAKSLRGNAQILGGRQGFVPPLRSDGMAGAHGLQLGVPEGTVQQDLIGLPLGLADWPIRLLDVGTGEVSQFRNVI